MSITKIGKKINRTEEDKEKDFGLGLGAAYGGILGTSLPSAKMVGRSGEKSFQDNLRGKDIAAESEEIIDRLKRGSNIKEDIAFGVSDSPKSITSGGYNLVGNKSKEKLLRQASPNELMPEINRQKQVLDRGGSLVQGFPDKDILAHELGHATGGKFPKSRPYQAAAGVGRIGMFGAPLAALGSAYMGSKDEDGGRLEKAVTYGPAAVASPALFEEGRASARGLNMIRKADGLKAALKAAPRMGLAGSTYAALAGAPIIANRVASRNRGEE